MRWLAIFFSIYLQNIVCFRMITFSMLKSQQSSTCLSGGGFTLSSEEGGDEDADDVIGKPVGPLPSVSSKLNFGDETPKNIQHDLWIAGAGTLGEIICEAYKNKYPGARIVAETMSTSRHDRLSGFGAEPRLREQRSESDFKTARNLIIAIPPSASAKAYVDLISDASQLWAGPLGGGTMVFTSSLAVYGESHGNIVNEGFRLDTRSSRSTQLIAAEEAVMSREGIAVRLAGLYNDNRGPHTYWIKLAKEGKVIESNADGFVNMIHYDDAASIVIAAVESGLRSKVLIGVDEEPLTRKEICASALASKLFPGAPMPQFASPNGPVGKRCDGSYTKTLLSWSPKYQSFRKYMRGLGGEEVDLAVAKQQAEAKEAKKSALWIPGDDLDDII